MPSGHFYFAGYGAVDQGGFVLFQSFNLLLVEGDGLVDFGGLCFDMDYNCLLLNWWRNPPEYAPGYCP